MQARLLADASRPGEPHNGELLLFIKAPRQRLTWSNREWGVLKALWNTPQQFCCCEEETEKS